MTISFNNLYLALKTICFFREKIFLIIIQFEYKEKFLYNLSIQ